MARKEILMPVPAIVGPTASGKSALAMALAERIGGEIVSCDSMQVYCGMDIGTAKPSAEERARIPHHMIDILSPSTPYNASDYARDARVAIDGIRTRGKTPIVCGGTGLYLDTLRRGEDGAAAPTGKTEARERLVAEAETPEGREALWARLCACDPESATATHKNNLRRVIRALEIYEETGIPKSEWDRRTRTRPPALPMRVIGLRYESRDRLVARINARVDQMMATGLFDEVARLFKLGLLQEGTTAASAIGYKELLPAVRGECTPTEAAEALKIATRQYAKRQMTWFASRPDILWITADEGGRIKTGDELLAEACAILSSTTNE